MPAARTGGACGTGERREGRKEGEAGAGRARRAAAVQPAAALIESSIVGNAKSKPVSNRRPGSTR
ncbi:hypothetical protein GCM10018791_61060 [Streptomyces zaomyceticus]|nr:hypothetical protein GCM10018791_61060 [Streptomyces zaomyceticus]